MKAPLTRYIDPLLDFSFKKIFGNESNKDLLISLLNEIFKGRKHIVDLVYGKNDHPGDIKEEGGAMFDVLCTGDQGEQFLIEVQRKKQTNFIKRAVFYAAHQISGQAPKGKRHEWGYNFNEVYVIGILGDFSLNIGPPDQFLTDLCLCDRDTKEVMNDDSGYIFIALTNFNKKEDELETNLDKWLYLLKNISGMQEISASFQEPIFEKLFHIAEYTNLNKEEKMDYIRSQMRRWDNQNIMREERREAREEGLNEGREKGLKEGLNEGRQEIARELKKLDLSPEKIAQVTNLAVEEVIRL